MKNELIKHVTDAPIPVMDGTEIEDVEGAPIGRGTGTLTTPGGAPLSPAGVVVEVPDVGVTVEVAPT